MHNSVQIIQEGKPQAIHRNLICYKFMKKRWVTKGQRIEKWMKRLSVNRVSYCNRHYAFLLSKFMCVQTSILLYQEALIVFIDFSGSFRILHNTPVLEECKQYKANTATIGEINIICVNIIVSTFEREMRSSHATGCAWVRITRVKS